MFSVMNSGILDAKPSIDSSGWNRPTLLMHRPVIGPLQQVTLETTSAFIQFVHVVIVGVH